MELQSPHSGANGVHIDTVDTPPAGARISIVRPGAPAKVAARVLTIREWPESERPREKLLERGAQALSDAELLALLLGSGIKGRSAVDIARSLIAGFGLLREVLGAERRGPPGAERREPARHAMRP